MMLVVTFVPELGRAVTNTFLKISENSFIQVVHLKNAWPLSSW